jgi:hypothetical protein
VDPWKIYLHDIHFSATDYAYWQVQSDVCDARNWILEVIRSKMAWVKVDGLVDVTITSITRSCVAQPASG